MRYQTYEAALARADIIQQVRAQRQAIERLGGTLEIHPAQPSGMTLVVVTLPEPYQPEAFFPDLPFYPV